MDEVSLLQRIETLKTTIRSWAIKYDLWHDCGFKTYDEHFKDHPYETPCVLVLWSEGAISSLLSWNYDPSDYQELCDPNDPTSLTLEDEFLEVIRALGFYYEMPDRVTLCFYPESTDESKAFRVVALT